MNFLIIINYDNHDYTWNTRFYAVEGDVELGRNFSDNAKGLDRVESWGGDGLLLFGGII